MCLLIHYTYTCSHTPEIVFKPCGLILGRLSHPPSAHSWLTNYGCFGSTYSTTQGFDSSDPRDNSGTSAHRLIGTIKATACPRLWYKSFESPNCVDCVARGLGMITLGKTDQECRDVEVNSTVRSFYRKASRHG